MLEELNILNYALIERTRIKFSKGLNIFTGETGAGKTILIGALNLLLGQKADTSMIRTGTEEAIVSGIIFVGHNKEAVAWLKQHGVGLEENTILIRRVIKRSGRGPIVIGSVPVTLLELREFSSFLFDFHGQHEHQSLLNIEQHRKLLDRFGNAEDLCKETSKLFYRLSSLKERCSKAISSERERLREIDLLKFAIREIEEANLKPGEEAELEREHRILVNHERLFQFLEDVYDNIAESRNGCLVSLRKSKNAMDEIIQIVPELSRLDNQLKDAYYEIEDFIESIRKYKSSVEYDPQRLTLVEERISLIHSLEKKYADNIPELLEYCKKCKQDLEGLEDWENEKKALEDEIKSLEPELQRIASELSNRRIEAAKILEKEIERKLENLKMPKVRFKVLIKTRQKDDGKVVIGPMGKDMIEFVISTNPGEPYKRLRKIASGGELSRIMLAIKSILAESDSIDVLIFDEVDAGIGGEVGLAVGEQLNRLSKVKQVLCITHLATIAVQADNHIKVEKVGVNGRTVTRIVHIRDKEIKEEISRMLSGDSLNETSLKHAHELIQKYKQIHK